MNNFDISNSDGKAEELIKLLMQLHLDNPNKNNLIISMSISNILINDIDYSFIEITNDDVWFIGSLGPFTCYIDLLMHPNTFKLAKNKKENRDNKINSVLGNEVIESYELEININF